MKKIAILNGPNLNRLGKREPEIYGTATLKDLERLVRAEARQLGVSVKFFQSNHEGALIDAIHTLADSGTEGFIVNFGAYSHTSIALHDALKSVSRPAHRGTHFRHQEARKISPALHDRRRLHRHDQRARVPGVRRRAASLGHPLRMGQLQRDRGKHCQAFRSGRRTPFRARPGGLMCSGSPVPTLIPLIFRFPGLLTECSA